MKKYLGKLWKKIGALLVILSCFIFSARGQVSVSFDLNISGTLVTTRPICVGASNGYAYQVKVFSNGSSDLSGNVYIRFKASNGVITDINNIGFISASNFISEVYTNTGTINMINLPANK